MAESMNLPLGVVLAGISSDKETPEERLEKDIVALAKEMRSAESDEDYLAALRQLMRLEKRKAELEK